MIHKVKPAKDVPPPASQAALQRGCICRTTLARDGSWRVRQDCTVHRGLIPKQPVRERPRYEEWELEWT